MSDDKWVIPKEYLDTKEEIERLRAELTAEREWKRANVELAERLVTVTAELADANDMKRRMTDACEEANKVAEQYRAELAAETKRVEEAESDRDDYKRTANDYYRDNIGLRKERDTLRAEVDARDAIIKELIKQLRALEDIPDAVERRRARELLARIDALLNEGGEDE